MRRLRVDGGREFAIYLRPGDAPLFQPTHDVVAVAFTDVWTGTEKDEIGFGFFCPIDGLAQLMKPCLVIANFDAGAPAEYIFVTEIREPDIVAFAQ